MNTSNKVRCPGHHVPFGDGWCLWSDFVLRSTGFPAREVLRLAPVPLASAVAAVLEAERQLVAMEEVLGSVRLPPDQDPAVRKTLSRLWKRFGRRDGILEKTLAEVPSSSSSEPSIRPLRDAASAWRSALDLFVAQFNAADERSGVELREIAAEPRFREAVTWQNRALAEVVLDKVVESSSRNAKIRQYERSLATYWQRYCVKNDTVGFFGPAVWSRIDVSLQEPFRLLPGKNLLATRKVSFEEWAIVALVDQLAAMPSVRWWLPPTRHPLAWIDGTKLRSPFGEIELPLVTREILLRCDGTTTPARMTSVIREKEETSEEQVHQVLANLHGIGAIRWPAIAAQQRMDQALLDLVESIEDPSARAQAHSVVDPVLDAGKAVQAAAGNAAAVGAAIRTAEEAFQGATSVSAHRGAGEMYAGRLILYEDCRRDLQFTLGAPFLDRIRAPLGLVLQAVRWFANRAADAAEQQAREAFDGLAHGRTSIGAAEFAAAMAGRLFPPRLDQTTADLQARWGRALDMKAGERRVRVDVSSAAVRFQQEFPSEAPRWALGRYASPDLIISGRSADAVRAGSYEVILGEIHPFMNTVAVNTFVHFHDDPQRIVDYTAADFPEGVTYIEPPREGLPWMPNPGFTHRASYTTVPPEHRLLRFTPFAPRGTNARDVSDYEILDTAGKLEARTRDGQVRISLLEFIGHAVVASALGAYQPFSPSSHRPRVDLGGMVVQRETWLVPVTDMGFVDEEDPATRFLGFRRLATKMGWPRFLFFRSPAERKPLFLDQESPLFLEVLSRIVRATRKEAPSASFAFAEMLPEIDNMWLPDVDGNQYSFEVRLVAIDDSNRSTQAD